MLIRLFANGLMVGKCDTIVGKFQGKLVDQEGGREGFEKTRIPRVPTVVRVNHRNPHPIHSRVLIKPGEGTESLADEIQSRWKGFSK